MVSFLRSLVYALALAFAGLSCGLAQAETLTNLVGSVDTGLSFRFQEHSWITSNGLNHVAFNDGTALRVFSETAPALFDRTLTLRDSVSTSSADGFLDKGILTLIWSTNSGLNYGRFFWSGTQWKAKQSILPVTPPQGCSAQRPTIAKDSLSRLWLAFTCLDSTATVDKLVVAVSKDSGTTWLAVDLGLDVVGKAGTVHGRATSAGKYVTVIYTYGGQFTDQSFVRGEAQHADGDPIDAWKYATLQQYNYTGSGPDPYGSHFSVLGSADGVTHLITNDGSNALVYFRSTGAGFGKGKQLLSAASNPAYMQLSQAANGDLYVSVNAKATLQVLQSTDNGTSFTPFVHLSHVADPSLDYNHPRMEAPSFVRDVLPVWQEVEYLDVTPAAYGALEYLIDLP